MTRLEAANRIAEILEAADLTASVWQGGRNIRVYVKAVELKSRGRRKVTDYGFLDITTEGRISTDHMDRQGGTVLGLIGDLTIEAEVAPVAGPVAVATADLDEDEAQFIRSQRATAAAESAHEEG